MTQNEKFKMITNDTQKHYTENKKINEQQEPHKKPVINAGAPEGLAVNASIVTVTVLLLLDKISSDMHIVLDKNMRKYSK